MYISADYFDLYLIHSPLPGKEKRLETWRALIDAKKAGKKVQREDFDRILWDCQVSL